MLLPTTETLPKDIAIDGLRSLEAARFMLDAQQVALAAVRKSAPAIIQGADVMAAAINAGNSIIYGAAGSSGLMALADACELPGTFGIPAGLIQIHMAGGVPADGRMPGNTEDDTAAAEDVARTVMSGDAIIVLSASGTTPYALQLAASAKKKGATIIGLANNPGTALLDLADVPICLETPPEVIAGSTRLGAGTAQKSALNLMSSLMGIKLGHVYQGRMVNVVADNAKLVKRAVGIVAQVAEVSETTAEAALSHAKGDVKSAILVALGSSAPAAQALLAEHNGHLGPCIQTIKSDQNINV
ncbi:N-acetylmuramic acid 6-phosphate etherase [Sulfitobacter sp. SK012]|uniref:N-acetylmuramic acid 6-phosphate etherase n=1 Tax=Sulfitobacter sp. SK012 TaxID=1389005 RepID=UPI000E0C82A4|nr:N-acetylmuramic acid 6-phosphate etherase [Sulfitobacter sp. SK012]AXI45463.1 N-acetylmuramic acid 6-phosphate etherase [Sulfitobacter sp. SK012]